MDENKEKLRALVKKGGLSLKKLAELSSTPLSTWEQWHSIGTRTRRAPGIAIKWLELYIEKEKEKTQP